MDLGKYDLNTMRLEPSPIEKAKKSFLHKSTQEQFWLLKDRKLIDEKEVFSKGPAARQRHYRIFREYLDKITSTDTHL